MSGLNKNSTQLSIPMDLPDAKVKDYAKQHWNITFARQKKVGVMSKRIMARVMSMISDDDKDFRPYYQINVNDLITTQKDKRSLYKEMKSAFDELTDLKWFVEDIDKQKFAYRHFLNTSDINCGYDDGIVTVSLNPILKPFFIELAHYTTTKLKWYMTFKSWYSMRLYERLSAFRDTGVMEMAIEDFREYMDATDKYPKTHVLLSKTLKEPIEELKGTDMEFKMTQILGEPKGKGRPPVTGLSFKLVKHNSVPKSIPKEWYSFSDEHKKVLESLKKWKVREDLITKYAKVIGLEGSKKLIKAWEEKERSDRKIDNKENYCTSAWARTGQELSKD